MPDYGISIDPLGAADMLFDISGNQARADRAYHQQNVYNQISTQLDRKKYDFARLQYIEGKRRDDNKLQRLVADANKAGISISTALGAAPSTPVSVSIPGHGTRVAGTAKAKQMPSSNLQITPQDVVSMEQQSNITNRTKAEADYAFFRMLNEKEKWEQSRAKAQQGDIPENLPNRYQLYYDNTKEAIEHYQNDGYVMPTGAQWELPQTLGGYEYFRPYTKPGKSRYDAEQHYYNNGLGIAP